MKRWIALTALLPLLAPLASADVLTPGSKLRVTFRVDIASRTPDVLLLNMGVVQVNQAYTVRSAALFDGATLLGTHSSSSFGTYTGALSLNPGDTWTSSTSPFNFDGTVVVPFSTIQNGTIHGAVEFTIQTGSMNIPLNQVNLSMWQASGPSSGTVSSPPPTVESVCIESGDFTDFCFGDGTGTACPCGNSALLGSDTGCSNSFGNGARLVACGAASIAGDTLVLKGSQMPNSTTLYFQGTSQINGGLGSAFGDGLRCAGGSIIRLGTKVNTSGASQYPDIGDQSISVRGLDAAGDVRTYQGWYRNADPNFCTTATFNLTNGIQLQWLP